MIYFDNNATTKIDPRVVDAMLPYLYEEFGNPSSKYYSKAIVAKEAVEEARGHVARLFGCEPDEVIFTSGATESNNFIIKGALETFGGSCSSLAVSKVEHSSILEVSNYLQDRGTSVTYIDVDSSGRIQEGTLRKILELKPTLVSIQWGNNETGIVNDIRRLGNLCAEYNVLFHTDATQVVGKLKTNQIDRSVRFLSLSAHKLHGPKGIGAAIVRKDELGIKTKLTPLLHGGGQESNYRSGTLSVHNIVGFGKAAEIAFHEQEEAYRTLEQLETYLRNKLMEHFSTLIKFNTDQTMKIPGVVSVQFKGVNNELIVKRMADRFALSTGSACSSSKPSHVLQSMGLSLSEVRQTIRISLTRSNTREEIDEFCSALLGN